MVLFFNHPRSTFRTNAVHTALSSHMRLFVPAAWADAVATRARAGLIAAAAPTATLPAAALSASTLPAATLAASTTKISVHHLFISLCGGGVAWKVQTACSTPRLRILIIWLLVLRCAFGWHRAAFLVNQLGLSSRPFLVPAWVVPNPGCRWHKSDAASHDLHPCVRSQTRFVDQGLY